jgi:hypothetical protein
VTFLFFIHSAGGACVLHVRLRAVGGPAAGRRRRDSGGPVQRDVPLVHRDPVSGRALCLAADEPGARGVQGADLRRAGGEGRGREDLRAHPARAGRVCEFHALRDGPLPTQPRPDGLQEPEAGPNSQVARRRLEHDREAHMLVQAHDQGAGGPRRVPDGLRGRLLLPARDAPRAARVRAAERDEPVDAGRANKKAVRPGRRRQHAPARRLYAAEGPRRRAAADAGAVRGHGLPDEQVPARRVLDHGRPRGDGALAGQGRAGDGAEDHGVGQDLLVQHGGGVQATPGAPQTGAGRP